MNTGSSEGVWTRRLVVALLVALAVGTPLPAPWRAEVIGDEMIHLESWRNRYRTDDMLPLFRLRLERHPGFSAAEKAAIERAYFASPLVQRMTFLLADQPSPTFSVIAETIEWLTRSNLVALRSASVVFSFGALVLAFLLGRELKDDALGLWLAALLAMGPLPQIFAGIGRPHALSQLAVLGVVLMFVRDVRRGEPSPRRFLATALFAQTTHWAGLAIVGPLVISALVRRYLAGASLYRLCRQAWWYAAASVRLLGLFKVQSGVTSV
jgi:hypothetical protein